MSFNSVRGLNPGLEEGSKNEAGTIASASSDPIIAPQPPEAQIEAPIQTAANVNAEEISAAEETQPHTTQIRNQLCAERKRVEKRKRSTANVSSAVSAQMSFDWA